VTPVSYEDWRDAARRRLPRVLFDYIDGGSYAEHTLRRNESDMAAVELRQRVMRDVSVVSTETELLGQRLAMPLLLAPVGLSGMYARRGEVQAARAARKAGVPFCLSTVGICSVEEVAAGAGTPPWFQLYMIRDRGVMSALLERAQALGCPALVLTVDLPVPGARYRDARRGLFGGGLRTQLAQAWDGLSHPAWLWDVQVRGRPHSFGNIAAATDAAGFADFWVWISRSFDPTLTWADLDWIRERWSGPVIVKGVLDPEDARAALTAGADALVVSNHGGRQLDGAASSISALPGVVDAVGSALPVLLDGGVRSGLDVLRALTLGARACLIGRPWAFALAARGEAGVAALLERTRTELVTAMQLTGTTRIDQARRTEDP
jgi:L-lactate dehydrogenase (cytochrome)